MSDPNELATELLKHNGITGGPGDGTESEQIQAMIRKERSKMRRMKWVTLSLWVAAVCGLLWGPNLRTVISGPTLDPVVFYIATFLSFLPLAAFVSTILLLARSWGMSRRETNLRLAAIEEQLRRLERPPDDP